MKRIIILIVCIVSGLPSYSQQSLQPFMHPTPDVASLARDVQTPISLSSGTVGTTIPLYNLQHGKITVPINISYDASGVRVNDTPGIVGQNWRLSAGGMITRVVKGIPDETEDYITTILHTNGDNVIRNWFPIGYFYNYDEANTSSWNNAVQITNWAKNVEDGFPRPPKDLEPDEFIFNFCGRSGSFFMNNEGLFEVKGEKGWRILVHLDLFPVYAVTDERTYQNPFFLDDFNPNNPQTSTYYDPYFTFCPAWVRYSQTKIIGFEIGTPDGFIYYFGEGENVHNGTYHPFTARYEAVESTPDFFSQLFIDDFNTWHLTKIQGPNDEIVEFKYDTGNLTAQFSHHLAYNKMSGQRPSKWDWIFGGSSVSKMVMNTNEFVAGKLISPVMLKEIRTDAESITFSYNNSNGLKYYFPLVDYYYERTVNDGWNNNLSVSPYFRGNWPIRVTLSSYPYLFCLDYTMIKPQKLNTITVKSKSPSQTVRTIRFTYNEDPTRRLQLTQVKENSDSPYKFEYNPMVLPDYFNIQTDHWGYYNNVLAQVDTRDASSMNNFKTLKEPDPNYTQAELLKRIYYPTGGYIDFEFEPNKYRKVVLRDTRTGELSLPASLSTERNGGGVRVKKITKVGFGPNAYTTHYSYGPGILNGEPKYYWAGYKGRLFINNDEYEAERFFTHSILPVSANAGGNSVSYSEVTQTQADNSRIVYTYSNHDAVLDENSMGSIDPEKTIFSPFSSKVIERGKLLKAEYYPAGSNTPDKREEYNYEPLLNNRSFIRAVYLRQLSLFGTGEVNAIEGSAYKVYYYPYNTTKRTEYLRSAQTNSEIKTETDWTYDSHNQVTRQKSGVVGQVSRSDYFYPYNFASGSNVYAAMETRNIITPIIETVNYHNDVEIDRHRIEYAKSSTITYNKMLPTESKNRYDGNAVWEINESITQYDKKGNPVEITGKDGRKISYIWGYGGRYIVAEIHNASFATVRGCHSSLSSLLNNPLASNLSSIAETALRAIADISVTTYVYKPLVGITKVTDASNRATSYEYDAAGRLVTVRDANGAIMQTYEYNIEN